MGLNSDLILQFQKITRYDLQSYLLGVEELVNSHYGRIIQFFTGGNTTIPSQSLILLDSLVEESERLDYIIGMNVSRFNRTDWWDLLEVIEDVKTKLKTMQNTPKWSRSSKTLSRRADSPETTVTLKQDQTLESLAGRDLGYNNEHQAWYQIAIRNNLKEEQYTPDGGTTLYVQRSGGEAFEVQSIVDIIDSETLKGKDVSTKITWFEDDLDTVSGDECFLQAMNTLVNLKKGDNPEFVFEGLSRDLVAGQNLNSIAYPILVRQITETFSRDDSIDKFSIIEISKRQDGIFVELEIVSKSYATFNISTVF